MPLNPINAEHVSARPDLETFNRGKAKPELDMEGYAKIFTTTLNAQSIDHTMEPGELMNFANTARTAFTQEKMEKALSKLVHKLSIQEARNLEGKCVQASKTDLHGEGTSDDKVSGLVKSIIERKDKIFLKILDKNGKTHKVPYEQYQATLKGGVEEHLPTGLSKAVDLKGHQVKMYGEDSDEEGNFQIHTGTIKDIEIKEDRRSGTGDWSEKVFVKLIDANGVARSLPFSSFIPEKNPDSSELDKGVRLIGKNVEGIVLGKLISGEVEKTGFEKGELVIYIKGEAEDPIALPYKYLTGISRRNQDS